jgi:hypothetical protein
MRSGAMRASGLWKSVIRPAPLGNRCGNASLQGWPGKFYHRALTQIPPQSTVKSALSRPDLTKRGSIGLSKRGSVLHKRLDTALVERGLSWDGTAPKR